MSVKVFISHSTKKREGEESCPNIKEQEKFVKEFRSFVSEQASFINLFIDEDIPYGASWRDVIFGELEDCDAAVVFVNRQALENSHFVNAEVIALGLRRFSNDDFILLLVPFGDVSANDIREKPEWQPVNIGELQCVSEDECLNIGDHNQVNNVFQKIVCILKKIPDLDDVSPSGRLVSRICDFFPCDRTDLKNLAKYLNRCDPINIDLKSLPETRRAAKRLIAKNVYAVGPNIIKNLVTALAMPKETDYEELNVYLSTYWVNLAESISLLRYTKESRGVVFLMSGKLIHYSPFLYLRQVCDARDLWDIHQIDITTENYNIQILSILKNHQAYGGGNKDYLQLFDGEKEMIDDFNRIMSDVENTAPFFVVFKSEGECGRIVDEILDVYKYINIIICRGEDLGDISTEYKVIKMKPGFTLKKEKDEFDLLRKSKAHYKS